MASSQFFTTPLPSVSRSEFSDFKEIGNPSMGHCRVIRTTRNGKWYVLKCLKAEYVNNPLYVELLGKEFEIGHSLDHPHIAKTIDLIVVEEYGPTILMEYIDGVTLDQVSIDKINARSLISELCAALSYAHSKQVTHLDLKPQNILVTHNGGHVKLIDFGLSNADHYTDIKEVGGTWSYAAPELLSGGDVAIDLRADIYSVGVIIEQLFRPFVARSVVRRATRQRPEDRYRSIEQMAEAIASARILTPRFWIVVSLLIIIAGCLWWFISIERTSPQSAVDSVVKATIDTTIEIPVEATVEATVETTIVTPIDSATTVIRPKVKEGSSAFDRPLAESESEPTPEPTLTPELTPTPTPTPTPEPEPEPLPNPNSKIKVSHEKLNAAGVLSKSLLGDLKVPFSTDMEQTFLMEFHRCTKTVYDKIDFLYNDVEQNSKIITQPIPDFNQLRIRSLQIAQSFVDSMFSNYDHPELEGQCRENLRTTALAMADYSKSKFFSSRGHVVRMAYVNACIKKEPLADSISRANPVQGSADPWEMLQNDKRMSLVWYKAKYGISDADIKHFKK